MSLKWFRVKTNAPTGMTIMPASVVSLCVDFGVKGGLLAKKTFSKDSIKFGE